MQYLRRIQEAYKQACSAKVQFELPTTLIKEERVLPMIPNGGTLEDMIVD